jgi:palmitoyltransferase
MPLLRGCSTLVIRCFKRVEHFADWITGAAGPWFVGLCWLLIGLSGIGFCMSQNFPLLEYRIDVE